MLIKIVDIKINNKKHSTTDLFLKFEDNNVSNDQYAFLKDRLHTFKNYITKDYSLECKMEYDKISENLFIEITIIIPEKLMPKDLEKCTEIIMNKIYLFRKFYEVQNELYKKNNGYHLK
jgi:hypothetical protein